MSMTLFRRSLTAVFFLASLAPCSADPTPVIHYAPVENFEHIDVALIDGTREITSQLSKAPTIEGSPWRAKFSANLSPR
jgi:hypothetical protein